MNETERRVLEGLRGRSGAVLTLIAKLPYVSSFAKGLGRELGGPLDVGPRRER